MPIPYAEAGVEAGKATATCPTCGEVFTASTSKQAVHLYGEHYSATHEIPALVEALKATGLDAHANADLGPTLIDVFVKGLTVHLTKEFNREDGGWEAVADNEGDFTPMDDGPEQTADVERVVSWATRVIAGLPNPDGSREALFSGEWLLVDDNDPEKGYAVAYRGLVRPDGYWSGGVQWSATHEVAKALVEQQNGLLEDNSDLGRMTIVEKDGQPVALVTYEPADKEFYTQLFDADGRVQVPSWTWFEVNADEVKEIIQ